MKGLKGFKTHLAAALIVTMIGSQVLTAAAASSKEEFRLNEDGKWTYWKNGEMVTDKMLSVTNDSGVKKTYYFKDDGTMASDETFEVYDIVDDEDVLLTMYAFSDGEVARNYWVHLNDEGRLVQNSENGDWYYFDKSGARLEGIRRGINSKNYHFDEDGKMLSRTFVEREADGNEEETVKFYCEYDGQEAKSKSLNIEGSWYCFRNNGLCKTASDSNAEYEFGEDGALLSETAPCRTIDSVDLKGDAQRTVEVGEELRIKFDVQLASDSNAKKQELTKNHDFWLLEEPDFEGPGNYKRTMDWDENGEVIISYQAFAPGKITMRAVIDEVESGPVTIESEWKGDAADIQKADAVNRILDSYRIDGSGDDTNQSVSAIKSLLADMEDRKALMGGWLSRKGQLNKLDGDYIMANGIEKSEEITEEAKALLSSGPAEIIGGALNAEAGDTVRFQVGEGENQDLGEDFERQAAFDLSLLVDNGEVSEFAVPAIIGMPVPKGMSKDGLRLFHDHGDKPIEVDLEITGNMAYFATDSLSSFIFAGNASGSSSIDGSGSGGRSSRDRGGSYKPVTPETPGSWKQVENGRWQFVNGAGMPYAATWAYVKGGWYWLDAMGYMAEGWQNIGGKQYFLTPGNGAMATGWLSDGAYWYYLDESGAMKTGWTQVGMKWYYLGEDGKMFADTETPDGHRVDASGARLS